jgi:hypothetical protein
MIHKNLSWNLSTSLSRFRQLNLSIFSELLGKILDFIELEKIKILVTIILTFSLFHKSSISIKMVFTARLLLRWMLVGTQGDTIKNKSTKFKGRNIPDGLNFVWGIFKMTAGNILVLKYIWLYIIMKKKSVYKCEKQLFVTVVTFKFENNMFLTIF